MNTVYSFRWKEASTTEGTFKRLYEDFNLCEGMKKVISIIQASRKEGFEISGFTIKRTSFDIPKHLICLQSI